MRVGLPQAGGFFLVGSSDGLGKFLWGKTISAQQSLDLRDPFIVVGLVPLQGSNDQNGTLRKER